MVSLYEETEKPANPIDFVKQFLGSPSEIDVEALKAENEALKRRVEELSALVDGKKDEQVAVESNDKME